MKKCLPHHKGCTTETCSTALKISLSKIGKKRPNMTGALHFNWKDGATPKAMKIRNSAEYAQWRKAVFLRDDYTCQRCGARGCKIEANHILAFATHPDIRLAVSNGETLCKPCHRMTPKPVIFRRNSEASRLKMSDAAKRRWSDPEKRPKRGPMSAQTRAKVSAAKMGQPSWNKGLRKETHASVAAMADKARTRMTGKTGKDSPVWKRWHPDHVKAAVERQAPE